MKQAYLADAVFTGKDMLKRHAVLTENKMVTGIVEARGIPSDYALTEHPDCLIAPAFIDLQIYGGLGKLFSHSLDFASLEATYAYCLSGGCTHFMITMATNSTENFLKGIQVAGEYMSSGKKGLLGIHLEGPYINPVKRGAHIEKFIKSPTREEVDMFLKKGRGVFKMITLAPEQCSDEIVKYLMDQGILVSAGHSNASYSEATHAFDLGIPTATHFFNAMSPLQGRAPGMVGAIYAHSKIMSSVICDGVHVDFDSVRLSKKIMGERLFFITDAVTQIAEGYYEHVFQGDRYTLPDGTLSGSCMTMMSSLKNAVEKVGIPLGEALKMCSVYPASLLKDPMLGKIAIGGPADFLLINQQSLTLKEIVN
ncbi:MAG: N-acetylglucosamine-6-phosphate deacetylase [Bacteroidota bacterium]|nr:N-acetylglucosamine-6-phosphate deacetylase [Bacteroidota bacterium]MDP4212270.1 N-acetylglucosamine-6-phosphate deacetylase [Bacteroidota bacterium]MDP4248877.1 N-acetylglucosamine-6-phosphate deacetylase [Bacteroidota bacterium]